MRGGLQYHQLPEGSLGSEKERGDCEKRGASADMGKGLWLSRTFIQRWPWFHHPWLAEGTESRGTRMMGRAVGALMRRPSVKEASWSLAKQDAEEAKKSGQSGPGDEGEMEQEWGRKRRRRLG